MDDTYEWSSVSIPVHLSDRDALGLGGGGYLNELIRGDLDRSLNPWRYPDANPMPSLVPFPRIARWIERAVLANERVRLAASVLRWGLPDADDR